MKHRQHPGGWLTAEYALLPRSTQIRTLRETAGLRGRTQEIRRLIGRSLRAAVDLQKIGERTCIIDCDVLQADGGTRTASITGGYVALILALQPLINAGSLPPDVLKTPMAAISVGMIQGQPILDLCYTEDSQADVDLNVVMNTDGNFIEIQGTAERTPFSRNQLNQMLDLASTAYSDLIFKQQQIITSAL